MIRFFVRLAMAALADWFTWQISTPEMRFWRVTRKYRRQITNVIKASTPVAQELHGLLYGVSEAFGEFTEGRSR